MCVDRFTFQSPYFKNKYCTLLCVYTHWVPYTLLEEVPHTVVRTSSTSVLYTCQQQKVEQVFRRTVHT